MSLKELFCKLCCSILNTNSNIPKISPFIHGDKLNKSNPGLLSPKRHLIKDKFEILQIPPTEKKKGYDNRIFKR